MTKPTGRPPGRPRKHPRPADDDDDLIGAPALPREAPYLGVGEPLPPPSLDLADVYGGVSAAWLAQIFGADLKTIKKKLARADEAKIGTGHGGTPRYSLPHAAAYLVKPKVDLVRYIKSLRPNDLPAILQDSYWAGMLKRQKWEENAGDLWRTEDVIAVFGDVAFMFKTTAQLWVEDMDRLHGLTPEMRVTLTQQVDKLLEQIHEQMVELPRAKRTPSSVAEEGAVPDEGKRPPPLEGADVIV